MDNAMHQCTYGVTKVSGATPADIFDSQLAASPVISYTIASWGEVTGARYHEFWQANVLPTELSGLAGVANFTFDWRPKSLRGILL